MDNSKNGRRLLPYLSSTEVWALSVGSAIGWGCLVVTGRTYLSQAGPLGSILGLIIGLIMMLMVSNHYHFLANRYPGTGGLYNYVKYIFGYDRAFLAAWFLFLIYVAIFWANATSVPLFARYFLGGVFRFGYLYSIFGYEVYLGEALITLIVMWLVGLLCIKTKKGTARIMKILVLIFTVGITVCFAAAMIGRGAAGTSMQPAFLPDRNAFRQVLHIAFISPWAFIGFESVSHSAAEYKFKHEKLFRILAISVVVTTALYIFAVLLSVSAYPEGCSSWLDYITRLDEFEGIAGLPVFYAADRYLGSAGVGILMASLLSLVITSLIGMLRALSRLCYSVAQDGILPERFAELNSKQIPVNAILLILFASIPIPMFGRTAVGWIVDTTTLGATIIYGFVSVAVFKASRQEGKKKDIILSGICIFILVAFLFLLLFPEVLSDHTIETETYILMTVWSFLGLLFFNRVIRKDHARKFGKAIIVWIALLAFIVIMTMTWVERVNESRENAVIADIRSYINGTADSETLALGEEEFFEIQSKRLHNADKNSVLIISGLFITSLVVLLVNHSSMKKWEASAVKERDMAREVAYRDPLTGAKSKHAFVEKESETDKLIFENKAGAFTVLVCDVNGLKHINDTQGHKAGDEYIKAAGKLICEHFKHSPVYRIGGDEFIVLPEGQDRENCDAILSGVNELIEKNIETKDVVISIGRADYIPGTDRTFHAVFERADNLMYERKKELKSMGAITRE